MDNIAKTWIFEEAYTYFQLPFNDLLFKAQVIHRENHNPNAIQISALLNIKTGSCPEDCSYCPQSAHYNTNLKKEPLMQFEKMQAAALTAKQNGATRFCMGAAWRGPTDKDLEVVCEMVRYVKSIGMESCVTLGLLNRQQAVKLKTAGVDYYNHNLDTSLAYYDKIITTRKLQDRLETLTNVQAAGMKVCSGGILGMGETNEDRIQMLVMLANLAPAPESVPINKLIPIPGTPLADAQAIDNLDFIKIIALARIMMPTSYVRLSAGREDMSAEMQAWCFFAGANSIFFGEKLLTSNNSSPKRDLSLFERLKVITV